MQYTAFRDGKSIGAFTAEQLKSALASGVLRPSDTYFGEGMSGITPLSQFGRSPATVDSTVPPSAASPERHAAPAKPAEMPAYIDWDEAPSGPVPTCCSRCQSTDIKSVPLVFKMGQSRGTMGGMSLSGDVGIATTHEISDLASELAPPVKASGALMIFLGGLLVAAFIGLTNGSSTASVAIGLLSVAGSIMFAVSASRTFAKNMYLWRNRWVCFKCGNTFLSVAPVALAALKDEQ